MELFESVGLGIYCCILAGIIGLVMGSFLNCSAIRIVQGERYAKGKSHCMSCGHDLGPLDLIPLFSWIFLGGKCRYCRKTVSKRYPMAELFMGLMSLLCLLRFGLTVTCLRNFVFLCCLFCLSLVDLDSCIIPDRFLIISAFAWIGALFFQGDLAGNLKQGLLGSVIIGGGVLVLSLVMDKVLKKESMGGGDIKLLFVSGLYLGLAGGLFSLILACILGLIFAVLGKRKNAQGQFPFGPAISLAVWIILLFGEPLIRWYLGLIRL